MLNLTTESLPDDFSRFRVLRLRKYFQNGFTGVTETASNARYLFQAAPLLIFLASVIGGCGGGSALPVGEEYQDILADSRLIIRSPEVVDVVTDGATFVGSYAELDDGTIRVQMDIMGSTLAVQYQILDVGLLEVGKPDEASNILYDKDHIADGYCRRLEEAYPSVVKAVVAKSNLDAKFNWGSFAEVTRGSRVSDSRFFKNEFIRVGSRFAFSIVRDGCDKILIWDSGADQHQLMTKDDAAKNWESLTTEFASIAEAEEKERQRIAEEKRLKEQEAAEKRAQLELASKAEPRAYGIFETFDISPVNGRVERMYQVTVTSAGIRGIGYISGAVRASRRDPQSFYWFCWVADQPAERRDKGGVNGGKVYGYVATFNLLQPPRWKYSATFQTAAARDQFADTVEEAATEWHKNFSGLLEKPGCSKPERQRW